MTMVDSPLAGGAQGAVPTSLPVLGVDAHAHVFVHGLSLASGRRYAPAYEATIDDYRAMLASLGLSHGVLVQPSFLGTDNGYLLDCLKAYPGQLRGIVVIDPAAGEWPLEAWHACGVVGVRANLIGKPAPDFGDAHWAPVLARMAALDWHLEIQVEAQRLHDVLPGALASGVRVVVDHFGRLDPVLGLRDPGFDDLLALAASPQVWVKVSGIYRVSDTPADVTAMVARASIAYGRLRDAFGVQRLVWGTDWPHTQFETTQTPRLALDMLQTFVPDAAERHALLVDAPARLFHLS